MRGFDVEDAEKFANSRGILVSRVTPILRSTTQPSQPEQVSVIASKPNYLAMGFGALALILLGIILVPTLNLADLMPGNTLAGNTHRCWRECKVIDLELYALRNEDPIAYWQQNYLRYGQIDLNNVDNDLRQVVKDWVALSMDTHTELSQIRTELQSIQAEGESMVELGQSLGATSREDPQGGALAGGLFMGIFAEIYTEKQNQEILDKHKPAMDQLSQRHDTLAARARSLGPILKQRYGMEFD